MAKVTAEEKAGIREEYISLRGVGYTKSIARRILSEKWDKGLTTIFDVCVGIEGAKEVEVVSSLPTIKFPNRYVITGWEVRVRPDMKFVACLQQLAKYLKAELILVPLNRGDARYVPQALRDIFHIVTETISFNTNLQLKYVESNALIQSPLSGHSGAYPNMTSIIPGLIRELRSEPSQYLVKQLISTGSVGHLDASINDYAADDKEVIRKWRNITTRMHGKPTAIAENYVVPSALVVDILDEKLFLTRFVSSYKSGVMYDLNHRFTPDGVEESRPAALIMGDGHAWQIDEAAFHATKDMIQYLNPKKVIAQDWFDGISLNHHEINNPVKMHSVPSIEEEAEFTKALLQEICDISEKVIYLQSNHCNFVGSFLNGNVQNWRMNRNYQLACELQLFRLETDKHPIIKLLDLESFPNLRFVEEKENFYIGKILCKHGHEGHSGSRVGFLTMAKIYNHYVCGHHHAPAIFRNSMCVGTIAKLDQGYNIGASAWLHLNGIVHEDSTCQALPIINGRWNS